MSECFDVRIGSKSKFMIEKKSVYGLVVVGIMESLEIMVIGILVMGIVRVFLIE